MNQNRRSWRLSLVSIPAGWWAALLTLPALVPLARRGFFESHDGILHLHRVAALDRAVRAGVLYPRWFPEFAFGYGHPVLNFYGPVSYYWALPFTLLGLDPVTATKLVLASGLVTSVLAMYLFARCHLRHGPALVAAVVYAYLPYHLVDLYVRGALAEFLAFVWFPLVLWAFHRLLDAGRQDMPPLALLPRLALAAFALLGLVATHSLSAFVFAPVLAGYLFVVWWAVRDQRAAGQAAGRAVGRVAMALGLGVAISAFYWLPVLLESHYVGLGHGTSSGYRDHLFALGRLVSTRAAYDYTLLPEKPVTFALGWAQASILVAGLLLVPVYRRRRPLLALFLLVGLVAAFMLTLESRPVWQLFERGLAFLQYPWRFHALGALAAALVAGILIEAALTWSPRLAALLGTALLIVVAVTALWSLPVQRTDPDVSVAAMWSADRKFGQVGATWTGEYLPVWVEEERWAISHPVQGPQAEGSLVPAATPGSQQLLSVGHTRYRLAVDVAAPTTIIVHQFYYPGWSAEWQGQTIAARPAGRLGLVAFDLPAGSGHLVARLALTPAQLWGTLISLATALALAVGLIAGLQSPASTRYHLSYIVPTACALLLAALLLGSLLMPNGHLADVRQVNANLEDTAELLAFRLARGDGAVYHPGDRVEVTLYWRALRPPTYDYKVSVQLTDVAVTRQPAQHDGDPGGGFTPTTRWLPGELVPDTHTLALPDDLAPGRYRLWAAMYQFPTVRNLVVKSSATETDGQRVMLAEIEVIAP
ncbi:MAG: hypothetical protein JXA93_12905 [Anaerolineae bacterium]|nr:hypothetical protein [Anaerolineae bacterium]